MIQQFTPNVSGMATYSATNPLDEVPVGPQVFPYGTPQVTQSMVEPYAATNYASQLQTAEIGEYPSSSVLQDANIVQQNVLPAASNIQYVQGAAPEITYDAGALQTGGLTYQAASAPMTSGVTTSYQTVVRYKPVTRTVMTPRVTTKYVQVPVNTGAQFNPVGQNVLPLGQSVLPVGQNVLPVGQSVLPVGQTGLPVGQSVLPVGQSVLPVGQSVLPGVQNLAASQGIPMVQGLQTSALGPVAPAMIPLSSGQLAQPLGVPPYNTSSHFVRNYPVYENDRTLRRF